MKKRILTMIITLILSIVSLIPIFAEENTPKDRQQPRLVDDAGLLNDEEKENLLSKLDEISERQKCDIAVVTVNSLSGKTATEFADDFYDYNGYGMGEGKDGILLLLSMENREWAISTYGYGITAFTDVGQDYMVEEFKPFLSDGEYAKAFESYANNCDNFITEAKTEKPYDNGNLPYGADDIKKETVEPVWIPISILIGAIVSFICVSVMKSKLKTVHYQGTAGDYVKGNSFKITDRRDLFLYRKVDKRAKPKDNDSGSGSSTHSSSSGRNHGGSSGSF